MLFSYLSKIYIKSLIHPANENKIVNPLNNQALAKFIQIS